MQTIPNDFRDLLDGPVAILSTVGPTGRPQQSVIWFVAENGTIRFSLNSTRQKVYNLSKNPACSLVIVDPKSTQRYLEVRGRAEVEDDPSYTFAQKVGAKYGADLRAYDQPGSTRVVVTVPNERVRTVDLRG